MATRCGGTDDFSVSFFFAILVDRNIAQYETYSIRPRRPAADNGDIRTTDIRSGRRCPHERKDMDDRIYVRRHRCSRQGDAAPHSRRPGAVRHPQLPRNGRPADDRGRRQGHAHGQGAQRPTKRRHSDRRHIPPCARQNRDRTRRRASGRHPVGALYRHRDGQRNASARNGRCDRLEDRGVRRLRRAVIGQSTLPDGLRLGLRSRPVVARGHGSQGRGRTQGTGRGRRRRESGGERRIRRRHRLPPVKNAL